MEYLLFSRNSRNAGTWLINRKGSAAINKNACMSDQPVARTLNMSVLGMRVCSGLCVSAGELTRQAASALTGPNSCHMPHGQMGSACCFGQRANGAPYRVLLAGPYRQDAGRKGRK